MLHEISFSDLCTSLFTNISHGVKHWFSDIYRCECTKNTTWTINSIILQESLYNMQVITLQSSEKYYLAKQCVLLEKSVEHTAEKLPREHVKYFLTPLLSIPPVTLLSLSTPLRNPTAPQGASTAHL